MDTKKLQKALDELEIANCNLQYLIGLIREGKAQNSEAKAVILETTELMERAKKNMQEGKL